MKVIITGAASGLGLACAQYFAREGHQVLMVDRSEQVTDKANEIGELAKPFLADLAASTASQEIVSAAMKAFGGIDCLVSNAGINIKSRLEDFGPDDWDLVQRINCRATLALGQAALPHLAAQGEGAIIAITSVAAHNPTPMCGAYSVAKAGLQMLVRQMALEWGPRGVRANCVSPGSIPTSMSPERYENEEKLALMRSRNPLGRLGTPEDIAAAVHYLAGPAARYINGAELVVDGGMLVTGAQRGAASLR